MDEFEGASVYYAATLMEAQLCSGDPVAVIGGGNSAGQATIFLARYASPVHLIVKEAELSENMSRYLIDRIERSPNVVVHLHSEVRELAGQDGFLHTQWLGDLLALDDKGFVLTGAAAGSAAGEGVQPNLLETSRQGVLAVGDVRSGSVKRVASAVGEGAMAVRLAYEHLQASGQLDPAAG
jgi:thioredoxin reductase (NADPH)